MKRNRKKVMVKDLTEYMNKKTGTTPEQREVWMEKLKTIAITIQEKRDAIHNRTASPKELQEISELKQQYINLYNTGGKS